MLVYWDAKGPLYVEFTRTKRGQVSDGSGRTLDAMVPDENLVKIKTRRESLTLGPGINEITAEEFEVAKPSWGLILKAKKLRVVRPSATALEPVDGKLPEARDIADLSVEDAQKIIERVGIPVNKDKDGKDQFSAEVGNRDTLYRFLISDERDEVQLAIKQRLVKLHLPEPTEDELAKVRVLLDVDDDAA